MISRSRPPSRLGPALGDAQPQGGSTSAARPPSAGLDNDSINSYALDGFTPPPGVDDPFDSIDLEALAEQVYLLLRREALLERERRGPQ